MSAHLITSEGGSMLHTSTKGVLACVLIALASRTIHAQVPVATPPSPSLLFWSTLDGARSGGGDCTAISDRLDKRLRAMPDSTLRAFADDWSAWWRSSYSWDLWGAAYVINGGSSDDGFDYFRGWLLTRGSANWATASTAPDSAFDDVLRGTVAECEDIIGTLPDVYEARFHRSAPDAGRSEPSGAKWTEQSLAARYPRLWHRFAERHVDSPDWLIRCAEVLVALALIAVAWKLSRARGHRSPP